MKKKPTTPKKSRTGHRPDYSPRWSGHSLALQDAEKAKLIEIAFPESKPEEDAKLRDIIEGEKADLIRRVEATLGWYPGAKQAVDRAPTKANIKAALDLLRDRCAALKELRDRSAGED